MIRVLACLVLGVLTTLGVAWGAPWFGAQLAGPGSWSQARFWADEEFAGHYQVSMGAGADSVRFLHIIYEGKAEEKPYYKKDPPPAWAFKLTHAMRGEGAAADQTWWGVDTFATGWPLRAFRAGVYQPWPTNVPAFQLVPNGQGGMTLSQNGGRNALGKTVGLVRVGGKNGYEFPAQPIWRNLVLNAAFFAAAWGLLGLGVGGLRRARRRRANRCAGCNYDLRGLAAGAVCPECGLARRDAAVSSGM